MLELDGLRQQVTDHPDHLQGVANAGGHVSDVEKPFTAIEVLEEWALKVAERGIDTIASLAEFILSLANNDYVKAVAIILTTLSFFGVASAPGLFEQLLDDLFKNLK
jgi:Mg2+/citrate symporter